MAREAVKGSGAKARKLGKKTPKLGGVTLNNESPNPYDNDGFENDADDEDLDERDHADDCDSQGEDSDVEDPLKEDVSSEGSCRTSVYQRSLKGGETTIEINDG